jgi:Zn-finger nucleic acid-binding protein
MNDQLLRKSEPQVVSISCPTCKLKLRDFELEPRLVLNFCQACKVAWCDRDEIGRMAGVREHTVLSVTFNRSVDFAPFGSIASTEPKCPRCADVHLVPASFLGTGVLHCPSCRGNLADLPAIGKIKQAAVAARAAARGAGRTRAVVGLETDPKIQTVDAFYDYGNETLLSAFAIPIALALGFVGQLMGLSSLLFLLGGTLPHEFGHALGGWLGGYVSVPTPFWTHIIGESSSGIVAGLFSVVLVACYLFWFRKGRKIAPLEGVFVRFIFIVIAVAQVKLAWMSNARFQQEFFIAMGVTGEFFITAVCVAFFCLRSVPVPRWDFWRYPVLLFGAVHFVGSWTMWGHVLSIGETAIPWGALIGASAANTADGDFSKLRDIHGWTGSEILHYVQDLRMVGLAVIIFCAAIQLGHFLRSRQLASKGHSSHL